MKTLKAAALALGFISFTGIQAADAQSESLMGAYYDSEGITYQVYSGGCTRKAHFDVLIQETFPVGLRLVRKQPDLCEAYIPYGVHIKFTWDELGMRNGDKFHFANQFAVGNVVEIP